MTEAPVSGTEIVVRVTPNASREQVVLDGSRYVIRVRITSQSEGRSGTGAAPFLTKIG